MSRDKRKPDIVLDPRRHAYRSDLAAESLFGRVRAERFAAGERRQVIRPAVPLRRMPSANMGLDTEALFGETLMVFEDANGWSWVQLDDDDYVGYLPSDALTRDLFRPTHRIRAPGTFVYPAADFKTPPIMHLSINSLIAVATLGEKMSELQTGGFVASRHIAEIGRNVRDYVTVAERLIGTPYLWGGKTRIGLDCSGLVQLSLQAAGIRAPRDSDMQQQELGDEVVVAKSLEGLERGDLVFWKGHVGMMADGIMLLHANAHHMATVTETLPEAAERIARAGSDITAVKRIVRTQVVAGEVPVASADGR